MPVSHPVQGENEIVAVKKLRGGFAGVCFPAGGIHRNSRLLMTPASNTKLYTSWLACRILGEDASFHSEYSVSDGTLYFRPRCNPLLDESRLSVMLEDLTERKIRGIVLETGYCSTACYPRGWNVGDIGEKWGAPISDVCFHENSVSASFRKGENLPFRIVPSSTLHRFVLSGTSSEKRVGQNEVMLPRGFHGRVDFAILSPENFLLRWLDSKLGKTKKPRTLRRGRLRGTPLKTAECTMKEVLFRLNKNSSNIIAELLLLHCAKSAGYAASTENGSALLRKELAAVGIRDAFIYDGSGLSRGNLVSPASTVRLLTLASEFESIVSSLPVGGVDGTLKKRKLSRSIRAKTGSLGGVQTLSGYAGGEPFSIMVNHFPDEQGMEQSIKDWIDETAMSFV